MTWALGVQGLEPIEKLLLLGIANHADAAGENAWPSNRTLARYVGRNERTVQRWLRTLESRGLVASQRNAGGTGVTRDDRRPNLYSLPGMAARVVDASPPGAVDNRSSGVTSMSPRDGDGVTSGAPRGDTAMSPEPSSNHPDRNSRDQVTRSSTGRHMPGSGVVEPWAGPPPLDGDAAEPVVGLDAAREALRRRRNADSSQRSDGL